MKSYYMILTTVLAVLVISICGCQEKATTPPQTGPVDEVVQTPVVEDEAPEKPEAAEKPTVIQQPEVAEKPEAPEKPEVTQKPPQPSKAQVTFESKEYLFGDIDPKKKYTGEFKFTSAGEEPLKVRNPKPCCGVKAWIKDNKMDYPPGESGSVLFRLDTTRWRGKITKQIRFFSDAAGKPQIILTFKANIVQQVVAEPTSMNLAFNKENAGCTPIKLTSVDGQPFAIKRFVAPRNAITAEFDPNEEATEFVITPKVNTDELKSAPAGNIKIQLTHPKCDVVAVKYTTLLRYTSLPGSIQLRGVEPNVPVERKIWILSNYGEEFKIESTDTIRDYIKVKDTEKVGNRYKLTIVVTPPQPKPRRTFFTDSLTVKTEDGDKIRIVCTGYYKK